MAAARQFGPAPDPGAPRAHAPLLPRDPYALREAIAAALDAGDGPGTVYARTLRPVLTDVAAGVAGGGGPIADDRRALARSTAQAALAELIARLPTSDEGLGRRAAVRAPPRARGEPVARALADALEAGGWAVTTHALDADADPVVNAIVLERAEVVVAPAADAAQVLASQRALALLRRVTLPPLIVGVAFAEGANDAERTMAADHVIGTADALAPLLKRRLGGGGSAVAWGVRLGRDAGGLVVAPVGLLDPPSVARLREIVETRRTLYPRIVIDLRELMEADGPGLERLVAWDAELPWDPTVAALGDARTLLALAEAGLTDALPLALLAG
jgi:hypothetical protein